MTYEKFLEKVKQSDVNHVTESRLHKYNKKYDNTIPYAILASGEIGGISGGSCWDSSDPQPYSNPEGYQESVNAINKYLATLLKEICPHISFLDYNIIYDGIIESYEDQHYEYYGNRTDYICHYITLKELYDRLVEHQVINNLPDNVESLSIE